MTGLWAKGREWFRGDGRKPEDVRRQYAKAQQELADAKLRAACLERMVRVLQAQREDDIPWLAPEETERLALLAESCGEVVQAVAKVLRHGWESASPYGGKTNRVTLEREVGQVRAVVNAMLDAGDLRLAAVQGWQRIKRAGLRRWTHHQPDSMPREQQLAMHEAIRTQQQGLER